MLVGKTSFLFKWPLFRGHQGTCEFFKGGNRDGYNPIPLACIDITSTGITALIQHGHCVLDLEFVSNHVLEIAGEQEKIIYIYGKVLVLCIYRNYTLDM